MQDLGKTIAILKDGAGFDGPSTLRSTCWWTFVDKVREIKPDIVGLGA